VVAPRPPGAGRWQFRRPAVDGYSEIMLWDSRWEGNYPAASANPPAVSALACVQTSETRGAGRACGVGDAGQRENPVLEPLDPARQETSVVAEITERLGEEVELARHRRARFRDRLDQPGEILRATRLA